METTILSPVQFTTSAVAEIKRLMNETGFNPEHHLRVGVKGGGCSGMTYVLGFDEKKKPTRYMPWMALNISWSHRMKCIFSAWRSTGRAASTAGASHSRTQMPLRRAAAVLPLLCKPHSRLLSSKLSREVSDRTRRQLFKHPYSRKALQLRSAFLLYKQYC